MFYLRFIYSTSYGLTTISLYVTYLLVPAPFVEKFLLSLLNCLCTSIENHSSIHVGVYLAVLHPVPVVICLCMHQKHIALIIIAFNI